MYLAFVVVTHVDRPLASYPCPTVAVELVNMPFPRGMPEGYVSLRKTLQIATKLQI